jgi:molybdate transport system substrate-binding protein
VTAVSPPRRRIGRFPLVAVLAAVLAACSGGAAPGVSGDPRASATTTDPGSTTGVAGDLEVYAAASLKAALAKAADAWHAANPGSTMSVSTDSSSALETKIEQGAPADVFLSADTTNPEKLVAGGLASGATIPFAGNRLVVIVPTDNPAEIRSPTDLARPGIKIVAAGDRVPVTTYATQLVAKLAREPGYPAAFAAAYAGNVVSREDNVAGILGKLELGEGDAGIVYVTDAAGSDRVTTIEVPDAANVPVTYGGVVVRASKRQAAARAFLDWLADPEGQGILAGFGFLPPPT